MGTIIYPSPIFGPVRSRRLGISLGVNLLPGDGKICTFDCIYCECGLNDEHRPHQPLPTRSQVHTALSDKLIRMTADGQKPDVITLAGNGEPTCHPQFADIVADIIALRDTHCPEARVSILSNATNLHRQDVVAALMTIDNNIQKIDTTDTGFITLVDRPVSKHYDIQNVIQQLKQFHGHVIIQTMFLTGTDNNGRNIDNTGDGYVLPWIEALKQIQPESVMIYTIDRETPVTTLRKASKESLDTIAAKVRKAGFRVSVSY